MRGGRRHPSETYKIQTGANKDSAGCRLYRGLNKREKDKYYYSRKYAGCKAIWFNLRAAALRYRR